jgi:hypothetical protein
VSIQHVANAIHPLPIHHSAGLEIGVVESFEASFAAKEELCDTAGPGYKHGSKHVVNQRIAGGFNIRDLVKRGKVRSGEA